MIQTTPHTADRRLTSTNVKSINCIPGNNAEDILQNLLEKFERFYNNSLESSLSLSDVKKTADALEKFKII